MFRVEFACEEGRMWSVFWDVHLDAVLLSNPSKDVSAGLSVDGEEGYVNFNEI